MLIGVAGALPARPVDIKPADAARLVDMGFQATSVTLGRPGDSSKNHLRNARAILTDAGLVVAQANGSYGSLVAPSKAERDRSVHELIDHMHSARELGALTCYVRPGGLNHYGPWNPDQDHHLESTFNRTLESLDEATRAAEDLGVTLAFEGHVLSTIDRPERITTILDAIDSPALTFNLDPVNFIGSIWDAWQPNGVFDRLIDGAGTRIRTTHWKDFVVRDELVLHIDEVTPGTGLVDHERWLRRLHATQRDALVLVEHLSEDQLIPAKSALDHAMAQAGLVWDSSP